MNTKPESTNTRARWLAAISASLLVLAACGTGVAEETEDTAPTTTATSMDEMDGMEGMEGMEGEGEHDHEHEHGGEGTEWAGSDVPTVSVTVTGDAASGWVVTADISDSFTFGTPEEIAHQDGVGHAHLVINGAVDRMIYEPTAIIDSLEPGMNMIEVRLASSDHTDYVSGGEVIAGMAMIEVEGAVEAADVTVEASYEAGEMTTDSDRVDVAVGDIVEITVSSDVAEEIHVHGYDITMDIDAGGSATIRFTAEVPGIFEVELEESGALIVELVIS